MIVSPPQLVWSGCSWAVKMGCSLGHSPCNNNSLFSDRLSDARELTWFIAQIGVWCFETELLELVHKEQEHFSGKCDKHLFFIFFLSQTSTFQQTDYEIRPRLLLHYALFWYREKLDMNVPYSMRLWWLPALYIKLDYFFFHLSQEFTHLALGRNFYRSPVYQKYAINKTWSNLASSLKPELLWEQAKQVAAQNSSLLVGSKALIIAATGWQHAREPDWLLLFLWGHCEGLGLVANVVRCCNRLVVTSPPSQLFSYRSRDSSSSVQILFPPVPDPLSLPSSSGRGCAPTSLELLSCGMAILTSEKPL